MDALIITVDAEKETVLQQLVAHDERMPFIIMAGNAHQAYRDPTFESLRSSLYVNSRAAGYEHMLIHLYQSLQRAKSLNLHGHIAELGIYKAGTTVFLARAAAVLGLTATVYAFDTFSGFPDKRSALDLYDDSHDVFRDKDEVARYCAAYNITIVDGDIANTIERLRDVPLILSFFDTDNYSPARAALDVCIRQTVRGGVIAFDHYWCDQRWLYTIGERIAAKEVLKAGFFNLHGTGVFIRDSTP